MEVMEASAERVGEGDEKAGNVSKFHRLAGRWRKASAAFLGDRG